jgi:hypothetical protein
MSVPWLLSAPHYRYVSVATTSNLTARSLNFSESDSNSAGMGKKVREASEQVQVRKIPTCFLH